MKTTHISSIFKQGQYLKSYRQSVISFAACLLMSNYLFAQVISPSGSGSSISINSVDAERLRASIDFEKFRKDIISSTGMSASDAQLFFLYLREQWMREEISFFQKAYNGDINYSNIDQYVENLKNSYIAEYSEFLKVKDKFRLERESLNNKLLTVNGPCTNMAFEDGTFNGWDGEVGWHYDPPTNDPVNAVAGFSEHCIMSSGMTDPLIPSLSVLPPGGTHSLRLGNTVPGGQAAEVSQSFLVDSSNMIFTYQYAVVLEDPTNQKHTNNQRPYFSAKLYLGTGSNKKEITCATYTVIVAPSLMGFQRTCVKADNPMDGNNYGCPSGAPGYDGSPINTEQDIYTPNSSSSCGSGYMDIYYKDWASVSIPLNAYYGQNVTIEFIAADCELHGHLGYAYVDAACLPWNHKEPSYVCSGKTTTTMAAPNGFASYSWAGPTGGIVSGNNTSSITVNKSGTYTVTLTPYSDHPCPTTESFIVPEHCSPPPVNASLCEDAAGSGKASGIKLSDYNILITAYHSPPITVQSWHTSLPPTNSNLISSTVTIHNGDKFYALIKYSADGGDTAEIDFTVNPKPLVSFQDIPQSCINSPAFQITGVSPAGGTFSGPHVISSGSFNPTVAGTFNIQYKYTNTYGCADSLSKPAIVKDKPTVSTSNQDLCANTSTVSLTASSSNATGTNWTGGNGTFSPGRSSLNATYTPTAAEKSSGTLSLTITATESPCQPVSAIAKITFKPLSTVSTGPDQKVCETTTAIALNAQLINASGGTWSGGMGTFTPSNSVANANYTPSASEISNGTVQLVYTASGTDPCPVAKDQMIITIVKTPEVEAGSPQTLCETATTVNLNGSASNAVSTLWTGGNGSFSPDAFNTTATYTPTASEKSAGSVSLTITAYASPCPSVSDIVKITFKPLSSVNAGPDQKICETTSSVSLNAQLTNASTGIWSGGQGSFVPNNIDLNAQYTPSSTEISTGTVQLTFTATGTDPCPASKDQVNIAIIKAPAVDAGPPQTLCENIASINLNGSSGNAASVKWSGGTGTFSPSAQTANATYTPSDPEKTSGSLTLTLTAAGNTPCASVSDNISFTFDKLPTVNAGNPQTVCGNNPNVPLNGIITQATQAIWSGGSGSFTPDASSLNATYIPSSGEITTGTVTLTLTTVQNSTCPPAHSSIPVTITPAPVVDAGDPLKVCINTPTTTLNGSVTGSTSYSWSGGSGIFNPDVNTLNASYTLSSGELNSGVTLTLTATAPKCLPVSDTVTIAVLPVPLSDAGPDQTVCTGTSVNLSTQNINDVTYTWTSLDGTFIGNGTSASLTANSDTSVVLIATNQLGCSLNDTMKIVTVTPPSFNPGGPFCFKDGMEINSNVSNIPSVSATIAWFRNNTLIKGQSGYILPINEDGIYRIQFTYGSCINSDSAIVYAPPVLTTPDNFIQCQNTLLTLSTSLIQGGIYAWHKESQLLNSTSNTQDITVGSTTDTYYVTVTDVHSCTDSDSIKVTGIPLPIVNVNDIAICAGDDGTLEGIVLNLSNITPYNPKYSWTKDGIQIGSDNQLTTDKGGNYLLTVSAGSCNGSDGAIVTINPLPLIDMPSEVKFCEDNEKDIILVAENNITLNKYLWDPGNDTSRTIAISVPGVYKATITNQFGCKASDETLVREVCPPRLHIGDAFSPDRDGINDNYNVYGAHIGKFHMLIFNRWGEIIYESFDREKPWNGIYRDAPMPIGVYPWIITYEGDTEEFKGPYKLEGSVTVVR